MSIYSDFHTWYPSPISKLNSDVLREIFALNTEINYERTFSNRQYTSCRIRNLIPLTVTRRTSQVCQAWRNILLGSPSIWASCIDLAALDQKYDWWRNLVLQRTGQAMLSVTGPYPYELQLEERHASDIWRFVVKLLQENWSRIRVLNISTAFFQPSDSPILEVIGRPAKNLRVFMAFHHFPPTLQLFSNDAPSLTCLSIGTIYESFRFHTASVVFGNLRYLKIRQRQLDALNFLEACLRIPFLQEIDIHVHSLIISKPNLPRPSMTKLAVILVGCPTLSIHPFLDCILPVTGCKLHVTHDFYFHTELPEAVPWDSSGLQHIIERYGKSFSTNHDKGNVDFTLNIDTMSCIFVCSNDLLSICLNYGHIQDSIQAVTHLVSAISAFKSSGVTNRLILHLTEGFIDILSRANLLEFLKSMPWTTDLVLDLADLSLIRALSRHELLFPSLKILTLLPSHFVEDLRANLIPFLQQQSTSAPLEVFDLSRRMWRHDELLLLDVFAGLKIIWMEDYGDMHEYTCGSRDGEGWDLLNVDAISSSPSDLDAALAAW